MSEEVGAGFGGQPPHKLSDAAAKCFLGTLGALAQECLEGAVGQLDRIEVRRVRRQIAQRRVRSFDRFAHTCDPVNADIVHHHDVAAFERRHQALIDIGQKGLAVHRSLDHHWGGHSVMPQRRHERYGLPGAERHTADHPFAPRSAAKQPDHVGVHRWLSRPEEFHLRPLAQRCVKLSISHRSHQVNVVVPNDCQCTKSSTLSPEPTPVRTAERGSCGTGTACISA